MTFDLRTFSFALLLCVSACIPQKPYLYSLVEESFYEPLHQRGVYAKYILIEEHFSSPLKKNLQYLQEKRFQWVLKGAKKLPTDAERNFLLGMLSMAKSEFSQAQVYFEEVIKEDFTPQAQWLLLDCQREEGVDRDYYSAYQQIYDRVNDKKLRQIIRNRFEYYRHGL